MKYALGVCALLSIFIFPGLGAYQARAETSYQRGTILTVEGREGRNHKFTNGTSQADAPLQSKIYAYGIAVRVACGTYVAHYESSSATLPLAIAANNSVEVRVGKHFLYFNLPTNQGMKMAIVRRKVDQTGACASTQAQP